MRLFLVVMVTIVLVAAVSSGRYHGHRRQNPYSQRWSSEQTSVNVAVPSSPRLPGESVSIREQPSKKKSDHHDDEDPAADDEWEKPLQVIKTMSRNPSILTERRSRNFGVNIVRSREGGGGFVPRGNITEQTWLNDTHTRTVHWRTAKVNSWMIFAPVKAALVNITLLQPDNELDMDNDTYSEALVEVSDDVIVTTYTSNDENTSDVCLPDELDDRSCVRLNSFRNPKGQLGLTANCIPLTLMVKINVGKSLPAFINVFDRRKLPMPGVSDTIQAFVGPQSTLSPAPRATQSNDARLLFNSLLLSELVNGNSYTVFYPTYQAFSRLSSPRKRMMIRNIECVRRIVRHHIIERPICSSSLLSHSYRDLNDVPLEVRRYSGELALIGSTFVSYPLQETDIVVFNGVIHVVDGLLFDKARGYCG